jgi:hypothetical protein
VERILFIAAGLMCIIPEQRTDIIGLAAIAVLIVFEIIRKKAMAKKAVVG